jgi:hypothetical protein
MVQDEIWKPVNGWDGLYMISDLGRIKALERTVATGTGYRSMRTYPERILKPSTNPKGYKIVSFNRNGSTSYFSVHRLVAIAFIENTRSCATVNHINSNKIDNRSVNLEWATHSEQQLHSILAGNRQSGWGQGRKK